MTNFYGCYIFWRLGIARVSFLLYVAFSSDHAYQWLEERKLPQSKKQGGFVKPLGSKVRYDTGRPPMEYSEIVDHETDIN